MKSICCHTKLLQPAGPDTPDLCLNPDCGNYLRPTAIYSPRVWNRVLAVGFFLFLFMLTMDDRSTANRATELTSSMQKMRGKTVRPLSPESLREELDHQHVICPEQVQAQILLESGNLESYLARRTNNLLGMRFPFRRKTTAIGIYLPESNLIIRGIQDELKKYRSANHYAVYENWVDCVADYKLWQEQTFRLTDRYLDFLGTYYAEDHQYADKIRNMVDRRKGS